LAKIAALLFRLFFPPIFKKLILLLKTTASSWAISSHFDGIISLLETRWNVALGKSEPIEKYSIEKQMTFHFPKTFI